MLFTDDDILECFPKQQEAKIGVLQLQIGKETLTQILKSYKPSSSSKVVLKEKYHTYSFWIVFLLIIEEDT